MGAAAKDGRIRSEKQRLFISNRAVMVVIFAVAWLAVALVAGVTVRGTTAERGMAALVAAYRERRPIEGRLSGGFDAGVYDPSAGRLGDSLEARDRAAELLREAAVDLSNGYAQLAYGRLLLTEGATTEAQQLLRRAVEMMPTSAAARSDLGVCHLERQEPERAIEEFEQALLLDPGMPEAWFNRSLCYQRLLLLDAAREGFSHLEQFEGHQGWRRDVRTRLDQTNSAITPLRKQEEIVAAFNRAFDDNDFEEARRTTRQNPEVMTRHVLVGPVVIDYLRQSAKGEPQGAERSLRQIDFIGKEFFDITGDTSVTDVWTYLKQLSSDGMAAEIALFEEYQQAQQFDISAKGTEARAIFQRLKREFGARGNKVYELITAHDAASCDYSLGEFNTSAVNLKGAIALADTHRWPYRRAQLATMLGLIYSRLGSDSLGVKYCEEALRFARGLPHSEAKVLQHLSLVYFRLGDYDKRLDYLRSSTRLYLTNIPGFQDLGSNYSEMASVYALRGEHKLALLYAKQALGFCAQAGDDRRLAQAYALTAVELASLAQFEQAEQELQRAFDQLQKMSQDGRSFTESQVFRRAGELALLQGQTDRALEYYWRAEGVARKSEDQVLSLIKVLGGRAEAHARSGQVDEARKALLHGVDLLSQYRVSITERSSKSDFLDANYAVVDQLVELDAGARGELSDAFDVLEESRARALLDDLRPAPNAKGTGVLKLKEIPVELPDNLTMLVYAVTRQRTYIFVITKSGWKYETSPATTETLDRLVHGYVSGLKSLAPVDELTRKGRQLYEYLIRPVEAHLKKGNGLCIVPDKALHFLPFASLVDGTGNYLMGSYPLTYSPSASVLVRCIDESRRKPAKGSETILAVGNPQFNRGEFTRLSDLPDAEQEARASASAYGRNQMTLIGREATKPRVLGALRNCDVAHLALHCLVEERSPWLAALVLADPNQDSGNAARQTGSRVESGADAIRGNADMDAVNSPGFDTRSRRSAPGRVRPSENGGLLYLDEVYDLSLPRTRLVVLSACQSGLGQYYRGEGIVSLVRPFLALGVPIVVASLWSVNSRATALLMIDFHSRRRAGNIETSEALRAAQLSMSETEGLGHPFYWAPFITVGFDR